MTRFKQEPDVRRSGTPASEFLCGWCLVFILHPAALDEFELKTELSFTPGFSRVIRSLARGENRLNACLTHQRIVGCIQRQRRVM
jgi:hypothetical protein